MSMEANTAAVRRFNEALNTRDLAAAGAVFAPNAEVHTTSAPGPLTVEDFKRLGTVYLAAFSGQSTIEDMIAEGDKVVSRIVFRGTHTGDLMGMPPTNKSVMVTEIIVDQFADGKIVETWRFADQMGLLRQLGVVPAPGQGGS